MAKNRDRPPLPSSRPLSELPPSILKQLEEHERAPLSEGVDVELTPELISQLKELETFKEERRKLEAEKASLAAAKAEDAARRSFKRLSDLPFNHKIGGRDGIDPSSLDIKIEEVRTSPSGAVAYIAWIPVPLSPVGHPDKPRLFPDGTSRPSVTLGKVSVNESLATAHIYLPRFRPNTTELDTLEVAITGYAGISISSFSPAEVRDRLARRDSKTTSELNQLPADNDSEVDGAISGTTEADQRPFIPSLSAASNARRDSNPSGPDPLTLLNDI